MGVITRANLSESLWPGVRSWFGISYDKYPAEWKDLFDEETSERAYEKYIGFVGMGLAPLKPEGAPVKFDDFRQGYKTEIAPDSYALAYVLTREEIRDNLYSATAMNNVNNKKAGVLADSMNNTKEVVAANVYNRMFNSSYQGADGVSILNTAHPNISGGVFSNRLATGADLSEASLEQSFIDISKFTNDAGLTIKVVPRSLHVPPELVFDATRILKSVDQSGTGNNDTNALRELNIFPEKPKVNHFFDDPNAYFIRTSVPGMVMITREGIDFDEDNSFDTKSLKYSAFESYAPGNYEPRAIFGSPG